MRHSAFAASNRLCVTNLPAAVDKADLQVTQLKKKQEEKLCCWFASIAEISFKACLTHTSMLEPNKEYNTEVQNPQQRHRRNTILLLQLVSLSP